MERDDCEYLVETSNIFRMDRWRTVGAEQPQNASGQEGVQVA